MSVSIVKKPSLELFLGPALLLILVSCERHSLPMDGGNDAAAPHDAHLDGHRDRQDDSNLADLTITLPWVSTYAGADCWQAPHTGHRLEVCIYPQSLARAADGTLYFLHDQHLFQIKDDQVSRLDGLENGSCKDGPLAQAKFNYPWDMEVGDDGTIFLADSNALRRISQGQVTTIAGVCNSAAYADGQGSDARFEGIRDIAFQSDGSLLVIDDVSIRHVVDRQVTTIAGVGPGCMIDKESGPALDFCLQGRSVLAVGNRIFFATPQKLMTLEDGQVQKLAGWTMDNPGFRDGPIGIAFFSDEIRALAWDENALYVADVGNNRIRVIQNEEVRSLNNGVSDYKDGPLAEAQFDGIQDMVLDAAGNIYVADGLHIRYIRLR